MQQLNCDHGALTVEKWYIHIYIMWYIHIYVCVYTTSLYPFICRLALRMFLSMFKQHFFKILAVLDLHCCTGFSLVVSGGSSLVAVHWLLIVVSSLVVEHGLQHAGFSRYSIWVQLWPQALDRWLSSCGALV